MPSKWTSSTFVSFALLFAFTSTLWIIKTDVPSALHHPVFFYLLPTVLVAALYGITEAILFAIVAMASSAFFLYDPIYSFYVSDPRALGELFWFLALALLGVKCVKELGRPSGKF